MKLEKKQWKWFGHVKNWLEKGTKKGTVIEIWKKEKSGDPEQDGSASLWKTRRRKEWAGRKREEIGDFKRHT
jgi:hypothetical protein